MAKQTYTDGGDIDLDTEKVYLPSGRRVTEAVAEELGREQSAAAAKRRGRPSITGRTEHTPHVSARVDPEVRARLEAKAAAEGKRLSDVVREAVEAYVRPTDKRAG